MDTEDHIEVSVSRFQRGDRGAFEELFRPFQPRLRYYVRNLNGIGNHADDLLQNVWLKVVRKIDLLKDSQAFVA